MLMQIDYEAYTWLMTLSSSERRSVWRKLATGEWILVWNVESHSFEYKHV